MSGSGAGARGLLVVAEGPQPGARFVLRLGDNVIGRDEGCEVSLLDETSSRRHAVVKLAAGEVLLDDLGSANGTRLNGHKLAEPSALREGDRIRVGSTTLVFRERERETVVLEGKPAQQVSVIEAPVATERARPGEAPASHLARLQAVCRLAAALAEAGPLEDLLARAGGALARELELAGGAVLVDGCDPVGFDGAGRAAPPRFSQGIAEQARRRDEALLFVASRDAELAGRASVAGVGTSSALAVPLRGGGGRVGVLGLSRVEQAPFDEAALALAVDLAGPLGAAIGQRLAARGRPPLIADDPATQQLLALLGRVAPSDASVLLTGETGVGKEVFSRYLHEASGRSGPLVALNMAALPEALAESELFGHEAGAFTGAGEAQPGKLRLADGGTLLLDEIGELDLELQAKLLRALESGTFYPVGGSEPVTVDVRVVAATNQDLVALSEEGRFRKDLYFRLAVVEVTVPPLRERPADILPLARAYLQQIAGRLARPTPRLSEAAGQALQRHGWPGNVRELRNTVERAVVLAEGPELDVTDLPPQVVGAAASADAALPLMSLKEAERWAIERALRHTGGKKGETVKLLGCSWPTLNKKIKDYGIEV